MGRPPQEATAAVNAERPGGNRSAPPTELESWLRSRVPPGGELIVRADGSMAVVHRVEADQTWESIASSYLPLTTVYAREQLVALLVQEQTPPVPGTRIVIPRLLQQIPPEGERGRLGPLTEGALRGLYVRGKTASGHAFVDLLDQMETAKLNLMVLDTKEFDGSITYPSEVKLAQAIGATRKPSMAQLERTIRFVHERGIRVAMRIPCFQDPWLSRARSASTLHNATGQPIHIGWVDPGDEAAQAYVVDLAREALLAGADEIQLDYVRYPVTDTQDADFRTKQKGRTRPVVIRDFVRRVHALTLEHGATLSVDVFGIVAEGVPTDLRNLGQDPALLAHECEALAPMVYPSHYPRGWKGYDIPGSHPELTGAGVSTLLRQLSIRARGAGAAVRPWLQAVDFHSPGYGPEYIASEISSSEKAGAKGYMLWNPAQRYSVSFKALAQLAGESASGHQAMPSRGSPDWAPSSTAIASATSGVSTSGK